MNQLNTSKIPSSSGQELPVKRKRGRPRKDESMARNEKRQAQTSIISSSQPPTIATTAIQTLPTTNMSQVGDNHNMVGQVVTGVIDGFFDAGYLISVRVGPNNTLLRGLVFQQGHFCQVTPGNDVARNLNMCRRENFHIPISNLTQLCSKQSPQLAMPLTMQNCQTNSSMQMDNLRMVGQDELMQVFEVSKMVEQPPKNDGGLKHDQLLPNNCDLTAESFHKNDIANHPSLPCGTRMVQDFDHEYVDDEANKQKHVVDTGMQEPPPSFEIDESEKQEGEVSKIDVNQVPNQGVATDLFQTDYEKQL